MSSDKDFEDMLEGLEIVTESLEEESVRVALLVLITLMLLRNIEYSKTFGE